MKYKKPKDTNISAILLKVFKKNDRIVTTSMGTFRVDRDGDVFIKIDSDFVRCRQLSL